MDKIYSDSPIDKADLELMGKEFLGFTRLFRITFDLIKKDFVRSFLKPFLWHVLYFFGSYLAVLAVTVLGLTIVLSDYFESNSSFQAYVLVLFIFLFLVSMVAYFVWLIFMILNITVRNYMVLNDYSVKGIWKIEDKTLVRKKIGNLLLATILVVLITYIGGIILVPFDFIASFTSATDLIPPVWSIFIQGINELVSSLPAYIAASFFGLAAIYSVLEDKGPINSLRASFSMTKPYYWQNVVRWIPLSLPGLLLTLCVYTIAIAAEILIRSSSFYSGTTQDSQINNLISSPVFANFQSIDSPVFIILIILFTCIAFVIGYMMYTVFTFYYQYTCYLNLKLLSTKRKRAI